MALSTITGLDRRVIIPPTEDADNIAAAPASNKALSLSNSRATREDAPTLLHDLRVANAERAKELRVALTETLSATMPVQTPPHATRQRSTIVVTLSSQTSHFKAFLRGQEVVLDARARFRTEFEQRMSLRRQVGALVWPYKNVTAKPPYSLPEIIVMAIVLNGWHKSKKGTHYWILQNFGYYRNLAMIDASSFGTSQDPNRVAASRLSENITQAFMDFGAPLFRHGLDDMHADDALLPPEPRVDTGRWTISSVADANLFLSKHLVRAPASSKRCKLMDLPAELRLRIYEFVLLFPRSGVQVSDRYSGKKKLFAFSRDYTKPPVRLSDPRSSLLSRSRGYCLPRRLDGPLVSTHLALFSVSKQIYQEAMPVFFGDNLFVCRSTRDLHGLLFGTTEERRNHIRHIAFSLIQDCKPFAAKTFKLLAKMPRLQELDIWIQEASFKTEKKGLAGLPGFILPGFPALRAMRGLQAARFHGECETVKKALEVEMTKPKKEKKTPVARKRKVTSSPDREAKVMKLV